VIEDAEETMHELSCGCNRSGQSKSILAPLHRSVGVLRLRGCFASEAATALKMTGGRGWWYLLIPAMASTSPRLSAL